MHRVLWPCPCRRQLLLFCRHRFTRGLEESRLLPLRRVVLLMVLGVPARLSTSTCMYTRHRQAGRQLCGCVRVRCCSRRRTWPATGSFVRSAKDAFGSPARRDALVTTGRFAAACMALSRRSLSGSLPSTAACSSSSVTPSGTTACTVVRFSDLTIWPSVAVTRSRAGNTGDSSVSLRTAHAGL